MADVDRMKVFAHRLPIDLIERTRVRAAAEHTTASALLRAALERALSSPVPVMPPVPNGHVPTDPATCGHPASRRVGYLDVCTDCRTPLPSLPRPT